VASIDTLRRLLTEATREHAILILDPEGRILAWNPGAEHIFGISAAEVIGQPLARFFTPEDVERGIPEHELAVARANGTAEDDRWTLRADGTRFWASGNVFALRDTGGQVLGFGKILRNRTDWKEQLDTLRNRVETLGTSDQHKTAFLATLSHELRNPMTPLLTAAQLLRLRAPDDPNVQFPISVIERQVAYLGRLVDDLLDVTRIGAGKVVLHKAPVTVQSLISEAVESVHPLVAERRHTLDVLVTAAPIIVDADAARLQQVLVNLITNAAKYTPPEGRIWVKATVEAPEAVIRVQDTGAGIPPTCCRASSICSPRWNAIGRRPEAASVSDCQ
jgi:PAS domain S-box-containing protein